MNADGSIEVDLIDDLHADEIVFYNALGLELARKPIIGRDPVSFQWTDAKDGYVHATVWRAGTEVAELGPLLLRETDSYTVSFGRPREQPERVVDPVMTDEWRITWTENPNPAGHANHGSGWAPLLRSEVFGDEGHARRWARHLASRGEMTGIRVERRRVTRWAEA